MTTYSARLETEIGEDGMLHFSVPEALPGSRVRVVVEYQGENVQIDEANGRPVRVFGQFKDQSRIMPGCEDDVQYEFKQA